MSTLTLAAAGAALAVKALNEGVALTSMAHPGSEDFSRYLTSKDAWFLKDYDAGEAWM